MAQYNIPTQNRYQLLDDYDDSEDEGDECSTSIEPDVKPVKDDTLTAGDLDLENEISRFKVG